MKPQLATIKMLFILALLYTTLFTCMTAAISLLIAATFINKIGYLNIDMEDVFFSLKAGIAAGIPTGAGIWISAKINESSKNNKRPE
ncbi:immunity protein [Pandoraea eparura]|uniref:immunity protein n=1 Tax=Pandoraea eparura TaxID=2508291 RepID=UPI00124125D2|nr:immunity protein [Pandoraea eparura]